MSEYPLIKYGSPTLAGIKVGNLMGVVCRDWAECREFLHTMNRKLNKKGIFLICLKFCDHRAWLYLFRPLALKKLLWNSRVMNLLKEKGYSTGNLGELLQSLKERLQAYCLKENFPHEIGFFLGYPIPDVLSFCENQGRNCLYCGNWKVYHDVEGARACFQRYKACTENFCSRYARGMSLESLAVKL